MREVLEFERLTPEPGPDADAVTHEFVARLDVDEPGVVEFGGIATVWEVLVDGAVVVSGRSAYERPVVRVEPGEHELRVVVHPLTDLLDTTPTRPRQRWRTALVDDARLRWVRTPVLGRAPGFAPGPPVVGPVQPVRFVPDRLRLPRLRAWLEGTTGVVEVDGRERIEYPDAELWWPHTHGVPVRHDVHADGRLVGRVGFRTVENRSSDSLDLWLNGVRVFCRGAVWTPGEGETRLAALDQAVALGLNLVRVPGTSAYESDAFHERCDALGLLVWQDLMFATLDYPLADPDFAREVEAEVRGHAERLRAHPSTVVVCGSAEHEQQAAMFGVQPETGSAQELAALARPIVEASGIDVVWVDGTPCGGDPVTRVDTGVAQYFGVGAYLRDLPDVRHSRVRFAGECLAFSNLPDPASASWSAPGVGVPRDSGADWDFADVREHYLRRRYGAEVADRDPQGPQAQRVTGELMAEVFGEWRRPDSGCGGGIVLWLRDLAPGAGWGLLDHTGAPKPAALALAPTLQPTAVWLVDEGLSGLDVHLAHDGPEPVTGLLTVELLREDGSVLDSVDAAVQVPARGHRVLGVEALVGRFCDVTWAYRFGPPQQAAVRVRMSGDFGEREATWRLRTS